MQIQRVIEESMGLGEEAKKNSSKNSVDKKNATMKVPATTISSASSPEAAESAIPEVASANQSFLHGQDSVNVVRNISDNKKSSTNERVVYATLDSLALKRARLPLQLVPIDENAVVNEKKDKIVGEKRINSSRKTSPKRPSFKVRPGVPVTGQWKSRTRPTPRTQAAGKSENVSKDLASKVVIFENIIRNNNRTCGTVNESTRTRQSIAAEDRQVPEFPESKENRRKHFNTLQNKNSEQTQETKNHTQVNKSKAIKVIKSETEESSLEPKDEKKVAEDAANFVETVNTENLINQTKCSTCTSESDLLPIKAKRQKPEFVFAKNVLHSLPISGSSKRSKKSKNWQKLGSQSTVFSSGAKSNLELSKNKSYSREELRYVSISLPTNFVHLASATSSKLVPDGESASSKSVKLTIRHEEKCAKLEYLGGGSDYQEIEIAAVAESRKAASRKSVRNSSSSLCDDEKTSCSGLERGTRSYFAETRLSGGFEESAAPSSLPPSSSSSSSMSLGTSSGDNERESENPAKVLTLEKSQGVPEVVKISENEGSVDEKAAKSDKKNKVEEETSAPVYEAMSEFSTSKSAATPAAVAAASRAANTSFLWGGRGSRRFDNETSCCAAPAEDKREILDAKDSDRLNVQTVDNSIADNDYDAYDDVGLSREDTEEDHYDDVGLPPCTGTKNSSTATLFEDIDVNSDSELYDDVLPAPIAQSSSALTIGTAIDNNKNNSDSLSIAIDSSSNTRTEEKSAKIDLLKICKERSPSFCSEKFDFPESDENTYLSISNDYSSVEDGQDDALYDDVELPSQDRVNSLYAGSSSGSQLGSLYNGKESEWEDLEEAAPVLPLSKKNSVTLRNSDSQASPSKKKIHRWSRKVRRQKSRVSRKNPSRSTSRTAAVRGTSNISVAVSLGTGSVLLVGSSTTTTTTLGNAEDSRLRPGSTACQGSFAGDDGKDDAKSPPQRNSQLQTRGLVQLRILGRPDDSVDTQETSCYVLEDTASDDSNYETLCSFPSDEFSSGSDDEGSSSGTASSPNEVSGLQSRMNEISQEAPLRPVPPPPRESSLTETFGKRMKMLRRTWSITKGSLGRMRRRTSATENETSSPAADEGGKCLNGDQPSPNNDGRKYFSFKKHFRKSLTGLSTFYLENETSEERLSRNNNRSKEEVYSNGSHNSWYTNTDYWKNSVSEQSQRNDVDHYSMLDEEPLYQFYAAAAARVAFESDSEGYEEVEDPMPSSSAVDLAKPGHRTLWCQTPQVVNSDLLQRLTADEKKVQEAKFEIFTSEASYLNSLRVLVDEFLNNHELVYEVLTPSEREKLFGGVPSVLVASERLLAELETVWREDVMLRGLPEVLLNYAQRSSSVYVAYCSNQVSIDTTLKELRSKKGSKFVETVTRIETHPACQSLSLHSFLMLPMQRVTRLPLLADAVLSKLSSDSKDERTCWKSVLSQLSQVVMECNEGARAAGRLAEMEALERKLEYSSKVPPIVLRDRYLVRRGPVVQMLGKPDAEYKLTFGKKYHKASLYLLLLTDYLLIAKPKTSTNEETYTVTDTCKRSLVALEKVPEDSPFAGRHAMVLSLLENYSGRHVEYILSCNNATERERWLDAVSPPKPSLVGESLYETWDCPQVMALYPYAAAQPDELTLQPGDVINVLRKMTDGWHLGEKLLGGEQGWFPGNYAKEVASEHVRARNLRQRHRLLALSESVMQQLAKQSRVH